MSWNLFRNLWLNKTFILAVYLLFAIVAGVQGILLSNKEKPNHSINYTHYNNYLIFKHSFFHLSSRQDLYKLYPNEHFDLYKYSPAFALGFGLVAWMPDPIGLVLWNILNALTLLLAVYYLPGPGQRAKGMILLTVLIELMTCMQNEQSNGLMAGLLIFAFCLLERKHYFLATLCIVSTVFIKLLGIAAFSLFIFYPGKWKLVLYSAGWTIIFLFIPLLVVDFNQLKFLYGSWKDLLATDFSGSYGLSVINWLKTWFGWDLNKTVVILSGAVLYCLPLLRIRSYQNYSFRQQLLCSLLIWVVIFNHKAESPTFVIAMSGIAIWFFSKPYSAINIILFTLSFILVSLSPTDLFPRAVREQWVVPFVLKAFPCILIWMKINYEMLTNRNFADAVEHRSTSI